MLQDIVSVVSTVIKFYNSGFKSLKIWLLVNFYFSFTIWPLIIKCAVFDHLNVLFSFLWTTSFTLLLTLCTAFGYSIALFLVYRYLAIMQSVMAYNFVSWDLWSFFHSKYYYIERYSTIYFNLYFFSSPYLQFGRICDLQFKN